MLLHARQLHKSLSRKFGHWHGRRHGLYFCPSWADIDAYTYAYLKAKGIIHDDQHA